MRVDYEITWSDRYAVHPCKINLFGSQLMGGRPKRKKVPASNWWKPDPHNEDISSLAFTHSSELDVSHSPGQPVTTLCTTASCPWPKQLFLTSKVRVDLTEAASWNLFKFPFDRQLVRAEILLVDKDNFANEEDFERALFDVKVPQTFTQTYIDELYDALDWSVYDLKVKYTKEAPDSGKLVVEIKIERNSVGPVFKCFIPIIANAGLVMVGVTLKPSGMTKVLSLSVVAGSVMLNPSWLGLPVAVEVVPFIQSAVIIHLAVCSLLLVYSLYHAGMDYWYGKLVAIRAMEHANNTWALNDGIRARYKKMTEKAGLAVEWAQPPGAAEAGAKTKPVVVRPEDAEPLEMTKADESKNAEQEIDSGTEQTSLLRTLVQAILMLPLLDQGRDITVPSGIWSGLTKNLIPGWGTQGKLSKYAKVRTSRAIMDRQLVWIVPLLYLVALVIDIIIYFGPVDPLDN